MQIGRVCGTVVSTLKHPALAARKLLLVEPWAPAGNASGRVTAAVDTVDAGPGDWVVFLDEGSSASQVLGLQRGPVRTVVVAVLDAVHLSGDPGRRANPLSDKRLTD
jgi:microcompartment protein CcmK/EutM